MTDLTKYWRNTFFWKPTCYLDKDFLGGNAYQNTTEIISGWFFKPATKKVTGFDEII